jgi:hypothetical protein
MENKKLVKTQLQLALNRRARRTMEPERQAELSCFSSCPTTEKSREDNGRQISKQ